jgi:ABC-2 type transport system permease protein
VRNALLVGCREFRVRVRSRGFLFTTFFTPAVILIMWAVQARAVSNPMPPLDSVNANGEIEGALGYVDPGGLIQRVPPPLSPGDFKLFGTRSDANAALERGEVRAYIDIPPDYVQTGSLTYVTLGLPTSSPNMNAVDWLLIGNLLPSADEAQLTRLRWPFGPGGSPAFVNLSPEGTSGDFMSFMLPFLVTIAVMIPLFTSGSFLLQSIVNEKSNRTLEVLLVSLQPRQLLFGKMIGLGLLTLIQYAVWLGMGSLWLQSLRGSAIGAIQALQISPLEGALVVPFALGGFLLYSAMMAGVGALAPDMEGSRAWVFLIVAPMMIPIYLWTSVVSAPDGVFAVALSLFPFSAPVAMLMRMTSTAVPAWQLVVSLALLIATGAATLLLMGRLFRVQTLLSGEPLSLRRFAAALREG